MANGTVYRRLPTVLKLTSFGQSVSLRVNPCYAVRLLRILWEARSSTQQVLEHARDLKGVGGSLPLDRSLLAKRIRLAKTCQLRLDAVGSLKKRRRIKACVSFCDCRECVTCSSKHSRRVASTAAAAAAAAAVTTPFTTTARNASWSTT